MHTHMYMYIYTLFSSRERKNERLIIQYQREKSNIIFFSWFFIILSIQVQIECNLLHLFIVFAETYYNLVDCALILIGKLFYYIK